MALTGAVLQECLRSVGAFLEKRRPPEPVRAKLDYEVHINGPTVQIIAVRPQQKGPTPFCETPIARVRWVASRQVWRLYWMRSDLKWHSYPELPETKTLQEALEAVDEDSCACFFG